MELLQTRPPDIQPDNGAQLTDILQRFESGELLSPDQVAVALQAQRQKMSFVQQTAGLLLNAV